MRPPARSAGEVSRRVGAVRPSQLMYAYGVGSLLDLPNLSVIVAGLDDWDEARQAIVGEERLLGLVRHRLGEQVTSLRTAPWMEETRSPFDEWARVGVPVLPFPRWLRCTACNYLGPIDAGLFELKTNPYRSDHARYTHGCSRRGAPPSAVPARFVVACSHGHLDDFPWVEFAHLDAPCTGNPILKLVDTSVGTRSTDMLVQCGACQQQQHLAKAFGEQAAKALPQCRGREPHLRRFATDGCPEQARALLLGSSNAWFAVTASVLSIPSGANGAEQTVGDVWSDLSRVPSRDALGPMVEMVPGLAPLRGLDLDEVWAAAERRRAGGGKGPAIEPDVLAPEWAVFTAGGAGPMSPDFKLVPAAVPATYQKRLAAVVKAERLREVVALLGFTRIDGPDSGVSGDVHGVTVAPLARARPSWVPAGQSKGEGVFIQLEERLVAAWEDRVGSAKRMAGLVDAHQRWRQRRHLDPAADFPGYRYLLLHSLSHALINEMALECGYSAASIRERIYAGGPERGSDPMAGVLLYTAAPDSEGTLGGLVSLGEPDRLGPLLDRALGRMTLCSSDPMCAEHLPDEGEDALHGAACHACLFVPETSCEKGNRYLDRSVLGPTMADEAIGFFA